MRSATAKVLHPIGGRSLLGHALAAARALEPAYLVVVVRHGRDQVAAHLAEIDPQALVADQDEVKGTGRAVGAGSPHWRRRRRHSTGPSWSPTATSRCWAPQTLAGAGRCAPRRTARRSPCSPRRCADPTGYGRVLRDADGASLAIVEQKDADQGQRAIREINSGIYAFDAGCPARRAGAGSAPTTPRARCT